MPEWCNGCGQNLVTKQGLFCEICWGQIKPFNHQNRCGTCLSQLGPGGCSFCESREVFFKNLSALFNYRHYNRRLLKMAKFEERPRALAFLSQELKSYQQPDRRVIILPSARPLVKQAARQLGRPLNAFSRTRTRSQNKYMSEVQRFANIKENLGLAEMAARLDQSAEYWLFDDIWTTGATMNHAARLLCEAGIKRENINALVLFRRDRFSLNQRQ